MRILLATALVALTYSCSSSSQEMNHSAQATPENTIETAENAETPAPAAEAAGLYALSANTLEGEAMDLSAFEGKVTLVVNVASQCGYTGQYAGLQELHEELADQGFSVLGFPSNQFGGQEPGSAAEIRQFCSDRYNVSFPMFAKNDVKGANQSSVYSYLQEQTGEAPGWNFCKYLVGKDGQVIAFYKSGVKPSSTELREAITKAMS